MNEEILELLKDDSNYYGELGRKYMSNSDIGILLRNPKLFKKPQEKTLPMLLGNYFHCSCLEPFKLKDFKLVDASTRTTNIYKDACKANGQEFMLLKKEAEEVDFMVTALRNNRALSPLVWDNGVKYEVPMLGEVNGLTFKGKADIINGDFIYDLKTTTNIDEFKYSAKKYNYDSQTHIYETLTGKQMAFIVIEKGTNRLGLFKVSDEFREAGFLKVNKAIEVYQKFYGDNATEDVNQYFTEQYLF
jgi:hypothetical protein